MHAAGPGPDPATLDVVICGGGLAGLTLARQIRRELPDWKVTVLERTRRPLPDACHKVGESSVETGSQYFERLGLREYLLERHIVKLGLRFFPGGGRLPLHERTEIGPSAEPIVRSYQLDRGRFEGDLRGMLEDDGVQLVEGALVKRVELGAGGARHVVHYELDGQAHALDARWVVDASGRAALLRTQLKLKKGTRHPASSGWFRIAGRFDIADMVPRENVDWHKRACAAERWRSTNHFMGAGYWAWVIPLSTGHTSIGLVIHEDTHDFAHVASYEAVMAFLEEHEPHLARALAGSEVKDFRCVRKYNNFVERTWSPERWALVGEAGAFVDPLYSPGSDFIAFANSFTGELMRLDQQGRALDERAASFNGQYRVFVHSITELFRSAAPIYGHAQAMAVKLYWDNFAYWSYTCQYHTQRVFAWEPEQAARFDSAGRSFVELQTCVMEMLRAWVDLEPARPEPIMRALPAFPSILVDAHIAVGREMSREEAIAYVEERLAQAREMVSEMLLRVVQVLGPEKARVLLERVRPAAWGLSISAERLAIEAIEGESVRRRRLPSIARELDRNLGVVAHGEQAGRARELLATDVAGAGA
ncbi:MAG: NAD(P)/FAD-dependent oxidoreductase [Planctomycetes bacterium]|nr:NAD(P)/FAD-dependent oxidoreductase [Planctomycetota bacterium]